MNDDRPTLPERYSSAIDSSHLEVSADERGDVDLLIAAGWVGPSLGVALYRLRSEWDCVRAELRAARRAESEAATTAADAARQGERDLRRGDCANVGELQRAMYAAQQAGTQAATTERALILSRLKSMRGTREAVDRYALQRATRVWINPAEFVVRKIAGRALEAWLDDGCPHCEGRGFNGGFGVPLVLCAECGGTGRHRPRLHHSDDGHAFGRLLLCEMDRKADFVLGRMRRFLSENPGITKRSLL